MTNNKACKCKISELLNQLDIAQRQGLIQTYEHMPGHYQIHIILRQDHTQEMKDGLRRHILKTYRDIIRADIGSSWVNVEYEI